jgi:hypothetical protein
MTIPMNQVTEADLAAARKERMKEIEDGGELAELPCPYCNLPRCDRSDYIRCSKCGLNWPKGYDYGVHPSVSWKAKELVDRATRNL